MRRSAVLGIAVVAALVIGAIIVLPRLAGPTALAPSTSPTASPSATPTASATVASGRFVNSVLGYSIQLPPPWRRSACLSASEDPRSPETLGIDTFTSVPAADESYGDTGGFVNTVSVRVERNPGRLSADAWSRSPRMGESQGQRIEPATLDGRAGVRLIGGALQTEMTIIPIDDLMYMVGFTTATPSGPITATMHGIVASFAFVARASAPAATAPPPRSAEALADALADGFARKDVAMLSGLMHGCVISGVEQGGAGSHSPERFAQILRDSFAAGLAVVVRPRPIEPAPGYGPGRGETFSVATTWTEPRQAPARIDLIIVADGAFHYWRGIIRRQQPP